MSSALASAKRKRAPTESVQQINSRVPNFDQQNGSVSSGPISLPKAFTLLNNRIGVIENKVKDIIDGNLSSYKNVSSSPSVSVSPSPSILLQEFPNLAETLSEYDSRFDILAEEVANMKNVLLSLQTYTMDVNKMLLEERIRVLSSVEKDNENSEVNDIVPLMEDIDVSKLEHSFT